LTLVDWIMGDSKVIVAEVGRTALQLQLKYGVFAYGVPGPEAAPTKARPDPARG
jgi:hypothetical protein